MAKDGESFAELFARESMPKRARAINVGEPIEGVVAHVSADAVLVDLDAKTQGFFPREEMPGAAVGAKVRGFVVAIDAKTGEVQLGTAFGRGASAHEVRIALELGVAVEGKIAAINKGGAEVEIAGGLRGFCPLSQLDLRRVEDPSSMVGRVFRFQVVEVRDREVVVSRRRLLEQEAEVVRASLREKLEIGSVLRGRVVQIREF